MTKDQFKDLFAILRSQAIDIIDQKMERALNSGAIDIARESNKSFYLPKCVMSAIGSEIESQFKPMSAEGEKEIENLKRFI